MKRREKMKLAFSTLGCPLYSIDEIIAMAERNQYEGVGIRTVRGKSMLTDLEEFSPKGIAETAKKFKKAGLAVSCVMSGVRFTSPEAEERKTQLKIAEAYIEIAVLLESPYVRIFGGPIKPEMNEKETLDRIIEGFRKAGDLAQGRGVLLLIETHDSFATGKKTRALLDAVKHPGIAVVWDILHTIRFGETLQETWDAVGDWVKDVHIKDSLKFSPESFDLKLPGKGILPIHEAVKLLREKGWDEWLTFEWEKGWHPEIEEPEVAIPFYADYMRTLLKL
jgi:sugar phosphate isomerase/epimerase